ncbi:MAG: cysteine desulfurase [Proteobacteria bacterium]|nr:cysteine desulfurase [Pseudomonadota bacterium]
MQPATRSDVIYLDNAATTAPDTLVVRAMHDALTEHWGNPSSTHALGLAAERALRLARERVAARLEVEPERVTFTSGGSEAIALALLGTARQRSRPGHVLVSAIEHAAVLRSAELLGREEHTVETIPVEAGGYVDPDRFASLLRPETFLVSVMHVNNETGIVQPVAAIAARLRRTHPQARLLVDAVQSYGVLPTRLAALGAHWLALSGHKLHGPKGVGCLVAARGVTLAPLWGGGQQEYGRRPGTENVPGIVGLGVAAELGKGNADLLRGATDRLVDTVLAARPGAYPLGERSRRAPHIAAVALPGLRADTVVNRLAEEGVYASSQSACGQRGRAARQSHVLAALGVPMSHGVLRLAPHRWLDEQQLTHACAVLTRVLQEARA